MKYLTFNNWKDLLGHVPAHTTLYMDITDTAGKPDAKYGLFAVTYYATITWPNPDNSYIAVCSVLLQRVHSLTLQHEAEKIRVQLHGRFDEFREQVAAEGFRVERGCWSLEPPRQLKGDT